jgi:hypothetical protein
MFSFTCGSQIQETILAAGTFIGKAHSQEQARYKLVKKLGQGSFGKFVA